MPKPIRCFKHIKYCRTFYKEGKGCILIGHPIEKMKGFSLPARLLAACSAVLPAVCLAERSSGRGHSFIARRSSRTDIHTHTDFMARRFSYR